MIFHLFADNFFETNSLFLYRLDTNTALRVQFLKINESETLQVTVLFNYKLKRREK